MKFICIFLCIFLARQYVSLAQQIGLTDMALEQELPSRSVTKIFQDSEGYMWFGSDQGISRYDAFHLITLALRDRSGQPVRDQKIAHIQEINGHLLLATQSGLYVLRKKDYAIFPFPDDTLRDKNITTMMIDRRQQIWVGTPTGIFVYDQEFTRRQTYLPGVTKKPLPQNTSVNDIFQDQQGQIWVSVWERGLFRLEPQTGHFLPYKPLGERNNPYKMFQDNWGQLWICSWGDGLFLFSPDRPTQPYKSISIANKRRKSGNEYLVYNILQDHRLGYIWVLSFSGITAFRYNEAGQLSDVDLSRVFAQTSNIFNDIYLDQTSHLWLAVEGQGVSTVNFERPDIQHVGFEEIKNQYGISPNLTTLYKDQDGDFWFNLARLGLGKFKAENKVFHTYSNSSFKDLVSIRAVNCIVEYQDHLWVGSSYESSINIFQKKGDRLFLREKIFLDTTSSNRGIPLFYFKDREENMWTATTHGVYVRRKTGKKTIKIPTIEGHTTGITQDVDGNLWIATQEKGIYKVQNKHLDETRLMLSRSSSLLNNSHVETVAADSLGKLWVGTKDGRLLVYDIGTNTVEEYANNNLFQNNQILDILYLGGNIWLSTSAHIYRIHPQKREIVEYTAADGLNVSLFTKGCWAVDTKSNTVYFGGYNGFAAFTDSQHIPSHPTPVKITDVRINNRSILMDQQFGKIDGRDNILILEPDEGHIEINFSSLEYHHPQKIRYAYKLEGVDKTWVYAPRGRSFASYNNLGKGKHRFLIKATDLTNRWDKPATILIIEKKPAFYESRLAYLLYTLTALSLAYAAVRISLNRLKWRSELRIAQIEKEKTEELVQAKLSYFTNISHDLLTPLTIISCLIDDIQITNRNHTAQFEKIRLNIERLKRLLKQILDFRRIENKQMQLAVSEVHLPSFIQQICTVFFSPLAKRKNIAFDIVAGPCSDTTYVDLDKLDKILFNLLSNAFKYTPDHGQISVDFHTEDIDQKTVLVLKVQDNGIGIAKEELDRIFVPFYSIKQGTGYESHGIGLALTKELVELHGGSISVESMLNQGTCFTVRLPVDPLDYENTDLYDFQKEEILPDRTGLLKEDPSIPDLHTIAATETKLLLVDDNTDLLDTIKGILSRTYTVRTAINGNEAITVLKEEDIDIVISDVMMPVMDGLALCRTLKADPETNHIPVILLTAKNSIEDRIECYHAGADGYIGKPFDLKVLEARIHSFLINKRISQQNFKTSPNINLSDLNHTPVDEQFLRQLIETIESHMADEQFDVYSLGDKMNLSKSTLYRKTKVLLNLSPSELIKNIRLKHAYQLMEKDQRITVSEVAFAVGFADPRYFSTCFKSEFGITPTDFQRKKKNAGE